MTTFGERMRAKNIGILSRTGQGSRTKDVTMSDGSIGKETREGDPDQQGYVVTTESGTDRADVVVQPNPVTLSGTVKKVGEQ